MRNGAAHAIQAMSLEPLTRDQVAACAGDIAATALAHQPPEAPPGVGVDLNELDIGPRMAATHYVG